MRISLKVQGDGADGGRNQDGVAFPGHAQEHGQKRHQRQGQDPVGHGGGGRQAEGHCQDESPDCLALRFSGPVQAVECGQGDELGHDELALKPPGQVLMLRPGEKPGRYEKDGPMLAPLRLFANGQGKDQAGCRRQGVVDGQKEPDPAFEEVQIEPEEDSGQEDAVLVVLRPPDTPVSPHCLDVEIEIAVPHVGKGHGGIGTDAADDRQGDEYGGGQEKQRRGPVFERKAHGSDVQFVEDEAWQMPDDQHDQLPFGGGIDHGLACGRPVNDPGRDILHRRQLRALAFEVGRHGRVGRAWLDQGHCDVRTGQAVLQPLGIAFDQPLGRSVDIIDLAAAIPGHGADQDEFSAAGRLEAGGKCLGDEGRREGVDLQGLAGLVQAVLAGRLVRQGAVGDENDVRCGAFAACVDQGLDPGQFRQVRDHDAGLAGGLPDRQVCADPLQPVRIAADKEQLPRTLGQPQPGAVFGNGRCGPDDDDFLNGCGHAVTPVRFM